jgi:S1-C subfamily serine protease
MKRIAFSALFLALSVVSAVSAPTTDQKNPSAKSYRVTCDDNIGSGFFINNSNAFITARHVISDCPPGETIVIHSTSGEVGKFIPDRESKDADLTIGRVERYSKFSDYVFTSYDVNCSRPQLGDIVYSSGHPKGDPKDTMQRGKVIKDPFPTPNHLYDVGVSTKYIPGMSGGPVTNAQGEAIGIVLWTYNEIRNVSGFGSIVSVCRDIRG